MRNDSQGVEKPKECEIACQPRQVCDYCQGESGMDKPQSAPLGVSCLLLANELEPYLAPEAVYYKWCHERASLEKMELIYAALRRCSVSETRAHSKSEYRRVTAQGGEILPPVATPPNTTDDYARGLQDAWKAVNTLIPQGELPGDGWDKSAERNGAIFAANLICALPGFVWP